MYNALQRFHLPKLDDLDVVDYDRDRGTVEATEALGDLLGYLNRAGRWRRLCLSSLALGGGAVALAGLAVALDQPISPALAGTLVLLLGGAVTVQSTHDGTAGGVHPDTRDRG